MEAYQGGSMEAFEALYAELAPPLLGYLGSLSRDAVRAEDLLQETFLQIHRSRHTYQAGRPVKPWVFAIARNVFLMHRRAATRRGRRETLADETLPELPVPPEVESLADRQTVTRALARLPQGRREALVLHHVLGMSFKEVGAALGITEGAAKVRAHRGMSELRTLLGERRGRS
jgi:RNA polymerase sigma-70 factor (ECF subfamily)